MFKCNFKTRLKFQVRAPKKVDQADIDKNEGFLLDIRDIKKIKEFFKKHPDIHRIGNRNIELSGNKKINKSTFHSPYTLIKLNNEVYAIYKGKKHGKHLGEGGFGKVKLMQNLDTKKWYAVKIINIHSAKDYDKTAVEAANLEKAKRGYGSLQRNEKGKSQLVIAMQYIHGKGLDDITIHNELELFNIINKLIEETQYIHKQGLIIRDIKPGNYIFDHEGNKCYLVDMGSALIKQKAKAYGVEGTTRVYETPENIWRFLHANTKEQRNVACRYDEASDVYQLGLAIGDLCHLTHKVDAKSHFPFLAKIKEEKWSMAYDHLNGIMDYKEIEQIQNRDFRLFQCNSFPSDNELDLLKENYIIAPDPYKNDANSFGLFYVNESKELIKCLGFEKDGVQEFMEEFIHCVEQPEESDTEESLVELSDTEKSTILPYHIDKRNIHSFYKLIKENEGVVPTEILIAEDRLSPVIEFLNQMTSYDSGDTPSMDEVADFFKQIQLDCILGTEQEEEELNKSRDFHV